jgi:hypothetical protein
VIRVIETRNSCRSLAENVFEKSPYARPKMRRNDIINNDLMELRTQIAKKNGPCSMTVLNQKAQSQDRSQCSD